MTAPLAPKSARPTRLLGVLQASTNYLAEKGVAEARLVSEWLFSHVLGCRRLELYLRFEQVLNAAQLSALRAAVRRLAAGEPLQYVIGECEFMGHRFKVDSRVLIPRPETERLVAVVLGCAALWQRPAPRLVDVATGSGCIAISLALAQPEATYRAVDISQAALEVAQENASRHLPDGKVRFEVADLLAGSEPDSADAVVANLPYIGTEDCARLPPHIRDHEPMGALDGGPDGLVFIRRLVGEAPAPLQGGGFLFLEIGHDQGPAAAGLMQRQGFENVRVEKDLGGRDRVVWGTWRCACRTNG